MSARRPARRRPRSRWRPVVTACWRCRPIPRTRSATCSAHNSRRGRDESGSRAKPGHRGGGRCTRPRSTRAGRSRAGSRPTVRRSATSSSTGPGSIETTSMRCSACRSPESTSSMGLIEIDRLTRAAASSHPFDYVVVDTAPTGHTLRLLAAPETVSALAQALDALQDEHRLIRDQLARVGGRDAADRLIEQLARQARRNRGARARSPPRHVPLGDAARGIVAVGSGRRHPHARPRSGIRVRGVVVNRAIPDGRGVPICDRRRSEERRVIDRDCGGASAAGAVCRSFRRRCSSRVACRPFNRSVST